MHLNSVKYTEIQWHAPKFSETRSGSVPTFRSCHRICIDDWSNFRIDVRPPHSQPEDISPDLNSPWSRTARRKQLELGIISVTRFGKISPLIQQKNKSLTILRGFIWSAWQNFEPMLANLYAIGQIFVVGNSQILKKMI